jgi:CheY-like chemotaxis protein
MKRILLVEDEDDLRKLLRLMLVKGGYAVVEARNGKEALAAAQPAEPFDLILTDLIMPEKEGIEIIVTFCNSFPDTKIIAMSGGGRACAADYLKIAEMMGAHAILAKPFTNETLIQTVSAALRAE